MMQECSNCSDPNCPDVGKDYEPGIRCKVIKVGKGKINMEPKSYEEKILLLGKHVIVTNGDFKGVTGLLKSIEIETDQVVVHNGHDNKELTSFTTKNKVNCRVIINSENTISVPLKYLSKLS